ncbi:pre-mRNA-splicing factor 38B-like [Arachis ipaensis]|uniref:pre-mRNA-splicing factor 38B-like n=1 Tax=Arachis ipaensis TaxID=130454 RepID=UPI0007AEFA56|nr:pre-mRNA-splicing factor 38B-like [Arachis ipaensis]
MDFVLVQTGTGSEVAPPVLGGGAVATESRQQQRSPPRDATQTHERRPFGGTGDNHARIMQELRHRMQDLERRLAERERDQRSPERSPTRSRSRSRSRRTPSPQYESESTGERVRPRRRSRDPIIYARHERRRASNRGNEEAHRENNESRRTARGPVIIGATPFHRSVLEVRLPKHFDKPTDMKYDGTQDPLEHLTAFEARMNLEGVGDEETPHHEARLDDARDPGRGQRIH